MSKQSWLKRIFKGAAFPPPAPATPVQVIGDVHGCLPLLQSLSSKCDPDAQLICVGDYVDRGEDSAGVLRWLAERPDIICLAGNHEAMMLGFIDAPEQKGARWVKYGGLQTLASFGISGISETSDTDALTEARDTLVTAMGPDLLDWMRNLATRHISGNVAVVHAGADPDLPIPMQSDKTLMWGHPNFDSKARSDGTWVIYGHTITPEPLNRNGRIGIDTGAYATGRLTMVRIGTDGQVSFTTT